jgi:predicted DNA-binding protein
MASQMELIPTLKTTIRFPQDLYRRLRIKAIEEGRPVATLVAEAVEAYLSNTPKRLAAARRE